MLPSTSKTERKTDNARAATDAKVSLRRWVLASVRPAHVFDGFCGEGHMRAAAWCEAASYAGCDEREWAIGDPPRYVADVGIVLRHLDLSAFNVFDFDAYGSPWGAMAILAARRRWAPGECGAVVVTDGSHIAARTAASRGAPPLAGLRWLGLSHPGQTGDLYAATHTLLEAAWRAWVERAGVEPLDVHRAKGRGSGLGGARMVYTALVFRGAQATTGSET